MSPRIGMKHVKCEEDLEKAVVTGLHDELRNSKAKEASSEQLNPEAWYIKRPITSTICSFAIQYLFCSAQIYLSVTQDTIVVNGHAQACAMRMYKKTLHKTFVLFVLVVKREHFMR